MDEDMKNPLILGRPFLATSRALIDMESGELMLRIYDENLVLQCLQKGSKKKTNKDKGKSVDLGESPHMPITSYTPHPSVLVGSTSKASSKDVSNNSFDPP
ncbi:hypothetical protein PIB30_089458 [Stylosanthes scabra]|uniref:Uncharacterized protein n=1 Tax=Stylosanthes scabra TaxID=79078 RepID=A0ABU6WTR9_9FABA|nr:hypothetical protein [Stylosanthes scabra]